MEKLNLAMVAKGNEILKKYEMDGLKPFKKVEIKVELGNQDITPKAKKLMAEVAVEETLTPVVGVITSTPIEA